MNNLMKSSRPSIGRYVFSPLCKYSSGSSTFHNYYHVLGITKEATAEEIKKAYYEKSMKYHPDKNLGSKEMFREISSAYEVLGNPRLRKLYDRGAILGNPNAVYEPTDNISSMPEENDRRPPEPESIRSPALDQWAKDHYSETFAKEQIKKFRRQVRTTKAVKEGNVKDSVYAIWVVMLLFLIAGFFMEKNARESRRRKSSEE